MCRHATRRPLVNAVDGPEGAVAMCRSFNQNFNIQCRAPRIEGPLAALLAADSAHSHTVTTLRGERQAQTRDGTSLVYGVSFDYASPAQPASGTRTLSFNHYVSSDHILLSVEHIPTLTHVLARTFASVCVMLCLREHLPSAHRMLCQQEHLTLGCHFF